MRYSALLLPLLFVSVAQACLNDRDSDSLAVQAKKLPDTLRVITGRFERNPPLYYEMRIRRALPQLKKDPRRFELYDDIAVAYDRLHRDDEALQIIEKKRSLLPRFDAKNKAVKEAWYRYYANAGTFYAHRWLGDGAKKESLGEMKKGRDYIKRALQIKPNAHFGREKYQLMTMEWIIASRENKGGTKRTLGQWIGNHDDWEFDAEPKRKSAATEGLAGLVVLGAAWQSPDIFEAIGASLDRKDGVTLRHMALLRSRELLNGGKRSFDPQSLNLKTVDSLLNHSESGDFMGVGVNIQNRKALSELYPKLRSEADRWSGHRSAYMLANLEKGLHPDTTPTFWSGWKPAAAPDMNIRWWNERQDRYEDEKPQSRFTGIGALWILFLTLAATFATLRIVSKRRIAAQ